MHAALPSAAEKAMCIAAAWAGQCGLVAGGCPQRAQYGLIKEYTLKYTRTLNMI